MPGVPALTRKELSSDGSDVDVQALARNILIASSLATRAKDSSKSRPSSGRYPFATRRALFFSTWGWITDGTSDRVYWELELREEQGGVVVGYRRSTVEVSIYSSNLGNEFGCNGVANQLLHLQTKELYGDYQHCSEALFEQGVRFRSFNNTSAEEFSERSSRGVKANAFIDRVLDSCGSASIQHSLSACRPKLKGIVRLTGRRFTSGFHCFEARP
ncbi:hypothetical protein Tco_1182052 [Tanacetum coccineum]